MKDSLPCSSRIPFGTFLSVAVMTAFLWFFNLNDKTETDIKRRTSGHLKSHPSALFLNFISPTKTRTLFHQLRGTRHAVCPENHTKPLCVWGQTPTSGSVWIIHVWACLSSWSTPSIVKGRSLTQPGILSACVYLHACVCVIPEKTPGQQAHNKNQDEQTEQCGQDVWAGLQLDV